MLPTFRRISDSSNDMTGNSYSVLFCFRLRFLNAQSLEIRNSGTPISFSFDRVSTVVDGPVQDFQRWFLGF